MVVRILHLSNVIKITIKVSFIFYHLKDRFEDYVSLRNEIFQRLMGYRPFSMLNSSKINYRVFKFKKKKALLN